MASALQNPTIIPAAVSESLLMGSDLQERGRPGTIHLRELYTPPAQYQTFAQSARLIEEVRAWSLLHIKRLGCDRRLARPVEETVTMCPYLYPDAEFEGNFLASAFLVLEFVSDDIFDSVDVYDAFRESAAGRILADELLMIRSEPRLLGKAMLTIIDLLRQPEAEPSVDLGAGISGALFLYDAFAALSKRLHAFGKQTKSPNFGHWIDSFTAALIKFSNSHVEIYKAIEQMSVEQYAAHKLVNCGMLHTVYLLELAMGCFLNRAQHAHPLIEEIKRHCIYVGSLLNEITSYEKEVFREHSGNLLLVVMLKERCDLREATYYVTRQAQYYADAVARLQQRAQQEFSGDDDQSKMLRRYVKGIELLTAACWYWQIEGTSRYRSFTSPFAELLVTF